MHLSKTKLKKFEQLFLARRQELMDRVEQQKALAPEGDDIDQAQAKNLNEINEKLSQRDIEQLRKVNQAIKRILEGTFGICEECEEEIGEKRLLAKPDTNVCISCAEYQEKLARQFGK